MKITMQSSEIPLSLAYMGQIEGADMSTMEKATEGVTGSFDFRKPVTNNGVTQSLEIAGTISPDTVAPTPTNK